MELKYDFAIQEIADRFVAVARDKDTEKVKKVFRLNATGALILQDLQDGKNEEEIVADLTSKFTVEATQAKEEMVAFLEMVKNI